MTISDQGPGASQVQAFPGGKPVVPRTSTANTGKRIGTGQAEVRTSPAGNRRPPSPALNRNIPNWRNRARLKSQTQGQETGDPPNLSQNQINILRWSIWRRPEGVEQPGAGLKSQDTLTPEPVAPTRGDFFLPVDFARSRTGISRDFRVLSDPRCEFVRVGTSCELRGGAATQIIADQSFVPHARAVHAHAREGGPRPPSPTLESGPET